MENNEDNKNVEQAVVEETKAVESPKKKGSSPVVIILVVLVLALVGFDVWYFALGGNKVLSGKTEEPEEKEKKDDNKENESVAVTLSEEEKKSITGDVRYLVSKNVTGKSKLSVSELSNQEILQRAAPYDVDEFTEEELDKHVKELFGNISFNHESITCRICDYEEYVYSATDKKYVKNPEPHPGHGGGGYVMFETYFESAEKNASSNELVAKFKIIYQQVAGDVYGAPENFYPTFTDMKNKTNGLFSSPIEWSESVTDESLYEKAYNESGDKIPYTIATYRIENGHYYIKTIELP